MHRAGLGLVTVLAAMALSGCGTIVNFASGDPTPYGGLQRDVAFLPQLWKGGGDGKKAIGILAISGAELASTGVADTVSLPVVVLLNRQDQRPEPIAVADAAPAPPPLLFQDFPVVSPPRPSPEGASPPSSPSSPGHKADDVPTCPFALSPLSPQTAE
jgi:hypothetical protein